MSKIERWNESRVIVDPRSLGNYGFVIMSDPSQPDVRERRYKQRCDEIIEQIRRHVDNVGYVEREDITKAVCSFCGCRWTEDTDNYNGGCCDQDEANNPSLSQGGES